MSARVHKLLRLASNDRRHNQRSQLTKLKSWWHGLTRAERAAARINILEMHRAITTRPAK